MRNVRTRMQAAPEPLATHTLPPTRRSAAIGPAGARVPARPVGPQPAATPRLGRIPARHDLARIGIAEKNLGIWLLAPAAQRTAGKRILVRGQTTGKLSFPRS